MTDEDENRYFNEVDYKKLYQIYFSFLKSNIEAAIKIIESGFNINYAIPNYSPVAKTFPSKIGFTLLHFTVMWLDNSFIHLILRYGADITMKNANGSTALHYLTETILDCLELKGPLSWPGVDMILTAHIDKNDIINPINRIGLSHFHIACMVDNTRVVEFFLQNGASVEEPINQDSPKLPGYTPLHLAARYSSWDTLELLLKYDADIHAKDAEGKTILEKILKRSCAILKVIKYIVANKLHKQLDTEFNINKKIMLLIMERTSLNSLNKYNLKLFHMACIKDEKEAVMNYLESGVDVNATLNFGYTALHYAPYFDYDMLVLLLKHGADIFAKDDSGRTPFDICVQQYKWTILDLILSIESLKNLFFSDNLESHDMVLPLCSYNTIKTFLENEEIDHNINRMSIKFAPWSGYTPLHLAVKFCEDFLKSSELFDERCNQIPINKRNFGTKQLYAPLLLDDSTYIYSIDRTLKLLINHRADFTAQDEGGQTPLHLAFYAENLMLIRYILSKHTSNLKNPYDNNGLSHFHIACFIGETELVEDFLRTDVQAVNIPIKDDITRLECLLLALKFTHNFPRSGWTPLHIAVARRHKEIIKLLLQNGADIFAKDADGLTPVHAAASNAYSEISNILLSVPGAGDSNPVVPGTGLSHFHVACISNNTEVVKSLLELGADVDSRVDSKSSNITNKNKLFWEPIHDCTPVYFATTFGRLRTLELLFTRGADGWHSLGCALTLSKLNYQIIENYSWMMSTQPIDGIELTQLHIACAMIRKDVVESLLKSGADVNSRVNINSEKWPGATPLHMAVEFSDNDVAKAKEIIKLLLKYGADLTIKNAHNETPLHEAHCWYKHEIVRTILTADELPNIEVKSDDGTSHFHIACSMDLPDVVEEFLKSGANVNERKRYYFERHSVGFCDRFAGSTPLHTATIFGLDKVIRLLLQYGADINAEDLSGITPLHIACYTNNIQIVELLLSTPGINVDATSTLGITPLQMTVTRDLEPITEVLLKNGAHINLRNSVTPTSAFEITLLNSNEKMANILISEAIDTASVNAYGYSCIHSLYFINSWRTFRNPEIYLSLTRKLLQRGCDIDSQNASGGTPFHVAVDTRNVEGVMALTTIGVDINVVNRNGKSAFELAVESVLDNTYYFNTNNSILYIILSYIGKLKSVQIPLNHQNQVCYAKTIKTIDCTRLLDNKRYTNELKAMQNIQISKYTSLCDVMMREIADTSIIVQNETLSKIVSSEDTWDDFPELFGLLKLKYKMAQTYRELLQDAEKSLAYVIGWYLPCWEVIANCLNKEDLHRINAIYTADQRSYKSIKCNESRNKRRRLE